MSVSTNFKSTPISIYENINISLPSDLEEVVYLGVEEGDDDERYHILEGDTQQSVTGSLSLLLSSTSSLCIAHLNLS